MILMGAPAHEEAAQMPENQTSPSPIMTPSELAKMPPKSWA